MADLGASTGALRTVHCSTGPKRSLLSMSVMDSWPGNLETIRALSIWSAPMSASWKRIPLGEQVDAVSIDVAFISLDKVLPAAYKIMKNDAFHCPHQTSSLEAGREHVGKKGVVRDQKVHLEVIQKVLGFAREIGFVPKGLSYSPHQGTGRQY